MQPENWKLSGKFMIFDGYKVFYRTWGNPSGEPLVLLHGYPTSSWDFHKMADALGRQFFVITADFLGFGFSEKPKDYDYKISRQAALIEEVLDRIGIESYHIFAHDYGDTVAQELLALDLDRSNRDDVRIRSVCFLNGGLFPETHLARPIQKLLLGPMGYLICLLGSNRTFIRNFNAILGKKTQASMEELSHHWRLITHKGGKLRLHKLISYIPQRIEHRTRWVSCLNTHPCPKALINGSADPVSGTHMVKRYQQIVDHIDFLYQMPEIGHYPHTEAPQETATAFLRFHSELASDEEPPSRMTRTRRRSSPSRGELSL
ncbi:MAG: alpha/beta hydrolase [Pseudobacteriovorax sp.]|nr:alpha/beta hydrolase [Pseudobacteriovorax sp.]